jgi:glycosyltransferase involved in cell wall biosynthesis
MPVFNGERFVERSIRSVLAQTSTDFELIISDNASTDRTEEICRDLASTDPRIRYHRNPVNLGAARNYNRLFELARGRYFRWSNADDLLAPTLHQRCLEVLERRPEVVLSYGKTTIIDEDDRAVSRYDDRLFIDDDSAYERLRRFFSQVGLTNALYGLTRTEVMRRTRLMGDGRTAAADTVLMGELLLHGKFVEIPEDLFYRRMHESASSWDRADPKRQREFWNAGLGKPVSKWRYHLAYLSAIIRAPLSLGERLRASGLVFGRMYRGKRRLLAELLPRMGRSNSST